ncbi:MAG TPA: PAS domain-containing sensor histidine kinase, partial [Nitrosopumilaceae archaeon]|nr:PAS domain-containing sensor histidine kinase [Nitrosopumilaceae archaeon]
SDESCRIYGIPIEENVQSLESFLSFIHPEDLDYVKREIDLSMTTLHDMSFDHRIIRRNGEVRHVHSKCKFEFDKKGKPIGIYGVVHDTTEKKIAEEKLQLINKELETFIYRASHDLRGPLASILGILNVSKLEGKNRNINEYISLIEICTKKMDETLSSLVQSITIKDTKKLDDPINFEELIDQTHTKFLYHEGFSRMEVTKEIALTSTYVSSKYIVESIFQNMMENAIKYQNYNAEKSYLKIRISEHSHHLKIEFNDNGIGMDESVQHKVFDMYFRGTEASKGSGLGLYLVKIGIEKLGGNVHFESRKGEGTRFTILLPKKRLAS